MKSEENGSLCSAHAGSANLVGREETAESVNPGRSGFVSIEVPLYPLPDRCAARELRIYDYKE